MKLFTALCKEIYYLVFALSGLGGENSVSGVKRGRWNKKVLETLV